MSKSDSLFTFCTETIQIPFIPNHVISSFLPFQVLKITTSPNTFRQLKVLKDESSSFNLRFFDMDRGPMMNGAEFSQRISRQVQLKNINCT